MSPQELENYKSALLKIYEEFVETQKKIQADFLGELDAYKKNAIKEIEAKSAVSDAQKISALENTLQNNFA